MSDKDESVRDLVEGPAAKTFKLVKSIGEGAFSCVYLGCYLNDENKQVAIKRINKERAFSEMDLGNECRMMRKLGRHENILSYIGLYTSKTSYHIVSEYMEGGELLDILISAFDCGESYRESTVAFMIRQICSAVAHCHRNKILHRDLKPENILVKRGTVFDQNMRSDALKVSDFGLAIDIDDLNSREYQSAGTVNYMAPERCLNKPYHYSSDIWSVGVVMYILVAGQFPFFGNETETKKMIVDIKRPVFDNIQVSSTCLNLLKKTLDKNKINRPTADELLEHQWTTGEVASTKEIGGTVKALRLFNAKNKFRATIRAIMATRRLGHMISDIKNEQISLELIEFGIDLETVLSLAKIYCGIIQQSGQQDALIAIDTFTKHFQEEIAMPDPRICDEMVQNFAQNGKIDHRKICLSLATKICKTRDQLLDCAFDIFDTSGDGILEFAEFSSMMDSMSNKPVERWKLEEEFNDIDIDGNKEISKEEFMTAAKSNFRIEEYLNVVERMLSNTWNAVKDRVRNVCEKKAGKLFVRESGLMTVFSKEKFTEKYCEIRGNDFMYWDDFAHSQNSKAKFCCSLKDAPIICHTEGSKKVGKNRPRFEVNKKSFEARSYEELGAWIQLIESLGVSVRFTGKRLTTQWVHS